MNNVPNPLCEVETKHAKQATFAGGESELIDREKLNEIKYLVLEKHNIDITSIILKIECADPDQAAHHDVMMHEDDAQLE